jgi:NosR/NirI family nitrous oxide reductase transcriptional regulator
MPNELPILNQPQKRKSLWSTREILSLVVVIWFVICWFIGNSRTGLGLHPFFDLAYPNADRFERINDEMFRAVDPDGQTLGYVATGTSSGYAGPLKVAVAVTLTGEIDSLAIVEHRETPAFVGRVKQSRLLDELIRKKHSDPISLDADVDAVSGATYTSRALTQSVGLAVHSVASEELNLNVPPEDRAVVFGLPEMLLIALFATAVVQRRLLKGKQRNIARWVTMIVGLVFLGFVFNSPFVLAHINMVLLGYWPDWRTHIFWYVLIAGLLLFKARRDWNVYCYDFCPFGAAQDVLAQIGGAKPRKVKWPKVLLWLQRGLVILAVSLALIYRNPSFTSFEIFGTMFRLTGSNFQFALLAIIVLLSLFLYRPWCRYLCPLHKNTMEGLFDRSRKNVKKLWLSLRPKQAT